MEDSLLKTKEVAARWQCDPKKVTRLASAGELPHIRLGPKSFRYRVADLERYEDEVRQGKHANRHLIAPVSGAPSRTRKRRVASL